jgi:hypothetical protein
MRFAARHNMGVLCGLTPLLGAVAALGLLVGSAGLADDWSGRFLGARLASGTLSPEPIPTLRAEPQAGRSVPQADSGAGYRVEFPPVAIASGETATFELVPRAVGSVFVEELPEQEALSLGWEVEISPGFQLRGSVSGDYGDDGNYSLSPEHRQLALTASFRF